MLLELRTSEESTWTTEGRSRGGEGAKPLPQPHGAPLEHGAIDQDKVSWLTGKAKMSHFHEVGSAAVARTEMQIAWPATAGSATSTLPEQSSLLRPGTSKGREGASLSFPEKVAVPHPDRGRRADHGSDIVNKAASELRAQVRSMTWEAEDVLSLVLVDADAQPLPTWEPGAHVDLKLPGGFVRQYSLCGDPKQLGSYRIAVLFERHGRGGSAVVHTQMRPGDWVALEGPRNHFQLFPSSSYLFIAGGIGITPILPMVAAVDREGAAWKLLYGGRSRSSMAFLEELASYGKRVTVVPQDEEGLLPLDAWLNTPRPGTLVYCCGPEPLLSAVEALCDGRWPPGSLQVERFTPRRWETAGNEGTVADAATTFEVECRASGIVVEVKPGCSVLQALRSAGIAIPSSCEEGICGTCETKVLSGLPDHRDSILSHTEQAKSGSMFVCVSRSRSPRLVLDC